MEGGYVLINLADIKLFERLLIALDLGKPILLRDGKQNYFIDKITGGNVTAYEDDGITPSTYADIVLTTGINEITIKQNGTIIKTTIIDVDGINEVLDINQENGRTQLSAPNEDKAPYISLSGNGIKFIDENGSDAGLFDGNGLFIENGFKVNADCDMDGNQLSKVGSIQFNDNSSMTTAPHLYEYVISIENTEDNYYGCLTILSFNNYTSDPTIQEIYNEVQEYQMVFSYGDQYNNIDYGFIKKDNAEKYRITGMFSKGTDTCILCDTDTDYNIVIKSKKQIF